jgi:hypothetical protein
VRLVDAVLRQGHLSEQALAEALMTGDRPAHLDRCDICAERALELGRWLDEVHAVGVEAADRVFTPEKLAAQQSQIMRKLEPLAEPARVIAFPRQYRLSAREGGGRRVAPAWVGVAAAAGLVIGVVSGHLSARLGSVPGTTVANNAPTAQQVPAQTPSEPEPVRVMPIGTSDDDFDNSTPSLLAPMNDWTPTILPRTTLARAAGG